MGILSPGILIPSGAGAGVLGPARMSMGGEDTLIRTNLLAYYRGGTEYIGLSVTDYDDIDPMLRSIFFVDASTLRDISEAVALALASPMLNITTMLGSEAKGVALYAYDTSEDILERAARYFRDTYEEVSITYIFNGFDLNGYTAANPPVVTDQDGALRISAAGSLAVQGGYLATTLEDGATLGPEIAPNWMFTQWSGDNPVGWTISGTEDANNYVTQHDQGARFVWEAGGNIGIYVSALLIRGVKFKFVLDVVSTTTDSFRIRVGDAPGNTDLTLQPGINDFDAIYNGTSPTLYIIRLFDGVPGEMVLRSISVREIIPVWKERTPAPAKKTLRTLTGSKTVYADTDPTAWPRATVNPTRTNKCTCRKINPVDTVNLAKDGDAAAVLSVVDAIDALANARLDKICTSGKAYRFDNSAGTVTAWAKPQGDTGNINVHSGFMYARKVAGGGSSKVQPSGGDPSRVISDSVFRLYKIDGFTPGFASVAMEVEVPPGDIVEFILPQLEEGAFCTDPIITAADPLASITRTGTSITKPTAGLFPMVSATEAQNFGVYARLNPKAAGQVAKLWASYTDANNGTYLDVTATTIAMTKRLTGTDIPVSRSITHAANVPIEVLAIQTDMGMSIKIRSYSGGTWSAWSAWTDDETANGKLAAKIAATLEIGAANTTSHIYGNVPLESVIRLGSQATLAGYKAVAEAEVNKINA